LIQENPENEIVEMRAGDDIYIKMPQSNNLLKGDIFIKIVHRSLKGNDKVLCRFGINTAFL